MTTKEKDAIAEEIRRNFYLDYRGDPAAACLYWSMHTVGVLKRHSIRAVIQGGSASWPRMRRDQDDGVSPTHFSYVFEIDNPLTIKRIMSNTMPEMHVWVGIPATSEIIDMTTGFWPQQCLALIGADWPGDKPPSYFWSDRMPSGVVYTPDEKACELAQAFAHSHKTGLFMFSFGRPR